MQKKYYLLALSFFTGYIFSCHSVQNKKDDKDSSTVVNPVSIIPKYRTDVKKEAIAEYKEKTDDPLNNFYFSVRLFETPKTFQYLLKMQFEEIEGEDTLRIPDLGIEPRPVLQKGKDKYSCVIGFLDKDNKFREYKLVHVKGGTELKLTPLRHYALVSYDK